MEILSNGTLVVDGGNGVWGSSGDLGAFGGGTGGVIQIISPMGNLSARSLSLRRGNSTDENRCNLGRELNEANGYYYLKGM